MKEQFFAKDHPLACAIFATIGLGGGLSIKGRRELGRLIYQVANGQHIQVSQVTEKIFGGSKYRDEIIGLENFPKEGSTLVVATPHTSSGSLRGIGKYAELCAAIYRARVDEKNETIREPFMFMGDGVDISDLRFPVIGKKISRAIIRILLAFGKMSEADLQFLINDLYASGGRSFCWERVAAPKFNEKRDIDCNQGANVPAIIDRILGGGAGILFPQGENCAEDDYSVPEKVDKFVTILYRLSKKSSSSDLRIVPVRCATGKHHLQMYIGEALPIEEIVNNRKVDLADFTNKYIIPLSKSEKPQPQSVLVS